MENSPLEDHFLNGNFPGFSIRCSIKKDLKICPGYLEDHRKSSGFNDNGNIIYKCFFLSQISQFFFYFPIPLTLEDRVILQVRSPSSTAFTGGWRVRWKNLWVPNQLTRDIISYICSYIMHIALTHASYKIDIEYRITYIYIHINIHIHRDMYVNRRFARANDADKSGYIQVSIDILCVSAPHPGGHQW